MAFQYIENKEQLSLPLLYKTLIEISPSDKADNCTNLLFIKYKDDF